MAAMPGSDLFHARRVGRNTFLLCRPTEMTRNNVCELAASAMSGGALALARRISTALRIDGGRATQAPAAPSAAGGGAIGARALASRSSPCARQDKGARRGSEADETDR
eukprot:8512094-Pyramimonas_sp.AAC.1